MKPVANTITFVFPKVGDMLELLPSPAEHGGQDRNRTRRKVVHISSCAHRFACRQDDNCHYCLALHSMAEEEGRTGQHCWNDCDGRPYWTIITEES